MQRKPRSIKRTRTCRLCPAWRCEGRCGTSCSVFFTESQSHRTIVWSQFDLDSALCILIQTFARIPSVTATSVEFYISQGLTFLSLRSHCWTLCAWPHLQSPSFHPSWPYVAAKDDLIHQTRAQSYIIQATNWRRYFFFKAWCLCACLLVASTEETLPFLGILKFNHSVLAGKHKDKCFWRGWIQTVLLRRAMPDERRRAVVSLCQWFEEQLVLHTVYIHIYIYTHRYIFTVFRSV